MSVTVKGHCPMGCPGDTLGVLDDELFCDHLDCPRPRAASEILADPEHEHIVVMDEEGFSIQHPLRERLEGELFTCGLHEHMQSLAGPPLQPGRYRVFKWVRGDWRFEDVTR